MELEGSVVSKLGLLTKFLSVGHGEAGAQAVTVSVTVVNPSTYSVSIMYM
jgi:hypothetical protein